MHRLVAGLGADFVQRLADQDRLEPGLPGHVQHQLERPVALEPQVAQGLEPGRLNAERAAVAGAAGAGNSARAAGDERNARLTGITVDVEPGRVERLVQSVPERRLFEIDLLVRVDFVLVALAAVGDRVAGLLAELFEHVGQRQIALERDGRAPGRLIRPGFLAGLCMRVSRCTTSAGMRSVMAGKCANAAGPSAINCSSAWSRRVSSSLLSCRTRRETSGPRSFAGGAATWAVPSQATIRIQEVNFAFLLLPGQADADVHPFILGRRRPIRHWLTASRGTAAWPSVGGDC